MGETWLITAMVAISMAVPVGTAADAGTLAKADFDRDSGQVRLTSGRLELVIDTKPGLNPRSMRDTKTGRVYADLDYTWPDGKAPVLAKDPIVKNARSACSATFVGACGPLQIEQSFSASAKEPGVIAERITLRNTSDKALDTSTFACGFTKNAADAKGWIADVAKSRFCNIPYRLLTDNGELWDFSPEDLATKQCNFAIAYGGWRTSDHVWGGEGWAWYEGDNTLMIAKYNTNQMEWSVLTTIPHSDGKAIRFGGGARWKLGDPEGAASIPPNGSFSFGETRYEVVDGDWKAAFYQFRRFTEGRGHATPRGYNPPVHWNELYDNPLWWAEGGDTVENRQKYYWRKDIQIEAEKCKEMGCEALYLDPGWDTILGSNIWAEERLGKQADFVKWLRDEFGIKHLSLHTPLAPWTDPSAYPDECRRIDKEGKRLNEVCTASSQYADIKVARLIELCRNGAEFLMYDGSEFPGECWNPGHGHSLPCTHQEHLDAILRMQQRLHKAYPKVLIEQHDQMDGPSYSRYVPTYFQHDKPGAFDELWGFEYMWNTSGDIISGRAKSLYYLNLAYSIPVYLHIDLRGDNNQALVFWWFASTCRHMGVGGKSKDPAIWEGQKAAMKTYLQNKRFFTQGVFYGIDEITHAHTLPTKRECVINCFNFTNDPAKREVSLKLADVGLPAGSVGAEGADCTQSGDEITLTLDVPAMGHRLVKLKVAAP